MKKYWVGLVYGVLFLLLIGFGIWASNCEKFEVYGLYNSPRCKVDAVYFKDEVCSLCGNSVTETGVLEGTGQPNLNFSDYFSSLKEYRDLKNKVLVPSVAIAITISCLIIFTGYVIYRGISRKKLDRRFKK